MYNLHLERKIEVAHKLKKHRGKCRNLHGHSLKIEVDIYAEELIKSGEQEGMVVDFEVIKDIIDAYDHTYLNDLVDIEMPTAEKFAEMLGETIGEVCRDYNPSIYTVKVRVYETETQSVLYVKSY